MAVEKVHGDEETKRQSDSIGPHVPPPSCRFRKREAEPAGAAEIGGKTLRTLGWGIKTEAEDSSAN